MDFSLCEWKLEAEAVRLDRGALAYVCLTVILVPLWLSVAQEVRPQWCKILTYHLAFRLSGIPDWELIVQRANLGIFFASHHSQLEQHRRHHHLWLWDRSALAFRY